MAVIATFKQTGDADFGSVKSGAALPADSIDIVLDKPTLPKSYLAVQLFDSSGDPIPAGSETGGVTVTFETDVNGQLEAPTDSVQTAAALTTIELAGPILRIKATVSTGFSAGVATWLLEMRSYRA